MALALMINGSPTMAQVVEPCGTMEVLARQLAADPGMAARMAAIEAHTQAVIASGRHGGGVITIPVVVHVVWNTQAQNISNAQVFSQIQVLNEDFRRTNSDAVNTPPAFLSVAADCEIEFCLATVDPQGNPTTGITRTQTNETVFLYDQNNPPNRMMFSALGGRDAWPRDQYLNIWCCNLTGPLGYAFLPGAPANIDGVVVNYTTLGRGGSAVAPYDLGRVTTHEVGHWLNLRHTWGDGDCGADDFVADTPLSDAPNFFCQTGTVSCGSVDMVENYMDYSNNACMNLFTQGQKARMRALFAPGGFRAPLLNSPGCGSPMGGPSCPSEASEPNEVCAAASSITVGAPAQRYVCPAGDEDWYEFSLTGPADVMVTLAPPQTGPVQDYDLELYASCAGSSSRLAGSYNGGNSMEAVMLMNQPAGTYRVRVWGYQGASSSSVPYTISITTTPLAGAQCQPEPGEPNNSCGQAAPISVGASLSRYICDQGDEDWYEFSLYAAGTVDITMAPPGQQDYDIQLFQACGLNALSTSQNGFSSNGSSLSESINENLLAGTYRIRVYGFGGAWSAADSYQLNLNATHGALCATEPGEPNNSCTTATPIQPGAPFARYICESGDVDWYQFTLNSQGTVNITMTPPQSPGRDYNIQLFAGCPSPGSNALLGWSANPGSATESISGSLPTGTYTVVVFGAGSGQFSASEPYQLDVGFAAGAACQSEPGEPNNNNCAGATPLQVGTSVPRFICQQGDVDWYQFTLNSASTVNITMTPPQSPGRDYNIQLFAGCPSPGSNAIRGWSVNPGSATEFISRSLSAGTYTVVVFGAGSGQFSASVPYQLTVQ